MELPELEEKLLPFCRAMYERDDVTVSDVYNMPGHAGFSYGFSANLGDETDEWYLRLPPPKVKWRGTADVLRQVEVLNALDGGPVPHCSVQWSGDDLQWFERPYFVVKKLEGEVLKTALSTWGADLDADARRSMANQAMTALAHVHKLDGARDTPYLGPPVPFDEDVKRWDTFYERAAEPELLADAPKVRETLLATIPEDGPVGVFHGDFQWSNVFYAPSGTLLAVIDWELTGVGATLNDVGWVATFNDADAWAHEAAVSDLMPPAEELIAMYEEAAQTSLKDIGWYRALAAYKFAIISGFNLALHRRGKRHDPTWEITALSMKPLIDRALSLIT